MRGSTSWLSIAAINLLLPIGILLFAKGFFPYKPFLPGLATFDEKDVVPPAPFDKIVFMVVDALRSDFVFSERSGFKFTQSLISSSAAIPYTAHATSPTITMPRVKAITTGSVPSFLDVILNFAESDTTSSLAQQDTWLAQIKAKGGKLVMYGDDTWIKLFPGMFERSDGTSSFFVSDFTEVDNNVTRHIDNELARDDWDAMVLHYLGLDHIGHKSGPQSAFMLPKQVEMDGLVERIYTAMETQPHLSSTLFILVGDHGMNDAGNHGGSGPGETSPALVFMSPKLAKVAPWYEWHGNPNNRHIYASPLKSPATPRDGDFGFYTTIEQSDVAPTIASLLGLPVPRNNLGVFIPEFVQLWNLEERVDVMMRSSRQLRDIVAAAYPDFERLSEQIRSSRKKKPCSESPSEVEELACLWAQATAVYQTWAKGSTENDREVMHIIEVLTELGRRYQDILSGVASNYDLRLMASGIAMLAVSSFLAAAKLAPLMGESSLADWAFPVTTLAYSLMMFASSFVEEEHHFWYWAASAWFTVLFLKEKRNRRNGFGIVVIVALLRVIRRWNQTGQKYAGAPDIAKTLLSENTTVLWMLIIVTYLDVFVRMSRNCMGNGVGWIFALPIVLAAFSFKLSFAAYDAKELVPWWLVPVANAIAEVPLVKQARAVFGMVAAAMAYTYICEVNSAASLTGNRLRAAVALEEFTDIFLLTQTRVTNIPLIFFFRLIARRLASLETISASELTLTTLILQHFSFFALGGTNAISSVDLSNAYNGVGGYSVIVVGSLTLVSNWAGPLFWASIAPGLLAKKSSGGGGQEAWRRHVAVMTTFYAVAGLAVMVACTVLRTHLFIWTVFSPKYLYLMAWSLGFHFVAGIGWGTFMRGVRMR